MDQPPISRPARRDLAIVALALLAVFAVAAVGQFGARWQAWSEGLEAFGIGDLPIALALGTAAILWYGLRRHREFADDSRRWVDTYERLVRETRDRERAEQALQVSRQALEAQVAELEETRLVLEDQGADLVNLAEDLDRARSQAEAANHAKSEFLANMSHELRTPLNAVIGFSEMIKLEQLGPIGNERYRDYITDIHGAGTYLLDLINDILDLSKVEAGSDELQEEGLDVPDILHAVEVLVRGRAKRQQVALSIQPGDVLLPLLADERKLKQILVNLMSNAIKFTDAGGRVELCAWCRADSGYVFQVVDTGVGIALTDIPKALSQFGQIDNAHSRTHKGTGLGLPLSKSLAELHGGSLDLQSTPGVGTTVTVRFPAGRIVTPA
jgi:signal transduction histidine kinase